MCVIDKKKKDQPEAASLHSGREIGVEKMVEEKIHNNNNLSYSVWLKVEGT